MYDKMKQLLEVRKQAETIKRQLEDIRIDVREVDGIHLVVDGVQNFHAVSIKEGLLGAGNKTQLESGLLRSLQMAIKKSQSAAAQKMAATMAGPPGQQK